MTSLATIIVDQNRDTLIEILIKRIRNYRDLLEDAVVTEDDGLVEVIQERIREDRQALNQLRA